MIGVIYHPPQEDDARSLHGIFDYIIGVSFGPVS